MNFLKVLSLGVGWLSVHLCASAETVTFSYTGAVQSFVVPPSVTSISIEAWGAQGGTNNVAFNGNQGGYATGTLTVNPGEVLEIYVGGQPVGIAGGFNGGGAGESSGAGGGGASDVRQGGSSLTSRALVAAGGGGGGQWSGMTVVGGAGGGDVGGDGYRDTTADMGGLGATQTAGGANGTCVNLNVAALGGSLGEGGSPAGSNCGCEGYGGGGGYYGGAGSGNCRGGGGGSSFITGLISGSTSSGLRLGNGEVQISYLALLPQTLSFAVPPVLTVNSFGTVSATSALPNSGNPILYSTTSTDCTVTSAGIVNGIRTGTNNCTILATQEGDATYAQGTASVTFSIGQASPPTAKAVPTVSQLGLVIMAFVIAGFAALSFRRI